MRANPRRGWLIATERRKQSGQALIYGLFMLIVGLAALFFLFNVSQLTREKTKLVNTSDAVAYSAGVMHARAMNFAAYTNRALVANEVAIAQMVSLASWGKYLVEHGQSAYGLGCSASQLASSYGLSCLPADEGMLIYGGLVAPSLGTAYEYGGLEYANEAIQYTGQAVVLASETSKSILQASQVLMMGTMYAARKAVMQDVASANYIDDGEVRVDEFPLRDTFYASSGGPIMHYYSGNDRTRMRDFVAGENGWGGVVGKDEFVNARNWTDTALIPEPSCLALGIYNNHVDRSGGTQLIGFDQWRAQDQATYYRWHLKIPKLPALPYCKETPQTLGTGTQAASSGGRAAATSDDWEYSGIPGYTDLSAEALSDPDPRAQFAVRVLRSNTQTRTSDARADINSTPRLNNYNSAAPSKVYVGLSASETFFQRPQGRGDGKKELASLFNPYWQTHLIEVPADVRAAAQALQGAVSP